MRDPVTSLRYVAIALVAATGCAPPAIKCSSNAQCGPGFRCELEVCVTEGPFDGGGGGVGGGSGGGVANACSTVMCPNAWEECFLDAGASCVSRFAAVQWIEPADAGPYGPAAAVPLQLRIQLRPGANPTGFFPPTLSYTIDSAAGGLLARSGQTADYGPSMLSVGSLSSGDHALDAGYVGLSAAKSFTVDKVAPVVTLKTGAVPTRSTTGGLIELDPDGAFATAFKKDEVVEVIVESTKPVAVAVADLQGVPSVAVTSRTSCSTVCAAGKSCVCFDLDLARVPLNGFRGTVSVTLTPRTDSLGNVSGAIAAKVIQVTRWKWKRSVAAASPNAVHAPAIDSSGNVFIGVSQTNLDGLVMACTPSGQPLAGFSPSLTMGAITSAPLISGTEIYIATRGMTQGIIRKLSKTTGTEVDSQCSYVYNSALALTDIGQTPETVVAVSANGFLVATRMGTLTPCVLAAVPMGKYHVVATADAAYLAPFASASIRKQTWTASAWGAVVLHPTSLATQGLAQFGTTIAGGGGAVGGGAYALKSDGILVSRVDHVEFGPGSPVGALTVAGTQSQPLFVYGNQQPGLVKVPYTPGDPGSFDAGVVAAIPPAAVVSGAPVVGRGGDIFVVDTFGGLTAYDSTLQIRRWSLPAGSSGIAGSQVDSSPSLDVQRDGTGAKVCNRGGILYVPSTGDGSLYAFAVDSDGIDINAPWPKYQHDPANTGNSATPLTSWGCP